MKLTILTSEIQRERPSTNSIELIKDLPLSLKVIDDAVIFTFFIVNSLIVKSDTLPQLNLHPHEKHISLLVA